jgi:hypothetical protein
MIWLNAGIVRWRGYLYNAGELFVFPRMEQPQCSYELRTSQKTTRPFHAPEVLSIGVVDYTGLLADSTGIGRGVSIVVRTFTTGRASVTARCSSMTKDLLGPSTSALKTLTIQGDVPLNRSVHQKSRPCLEMAWKGAPQCRLYSPDRNLNVLGVELVQFIADALAEFDRGSNAVFPELVRVGL